MPSASSKQASQTSSTEGTDAMRQSLAVIEKKIRNLEKRKGKLDGYKNMVQAGEELNKDQRDAIAKFDEVVSNLEFAKDLFKQFQAILQDGLKQQKKVAKREQLHRQEHEQKRLKSVLELQDMLEQLGSENVRKDFTEGSHGAITLTEEELKCIDEFYKLVLPSRETEEGEEKDSFSEKQNSASEHLISFLDAKPKDVCGTTYKGLKDIFDRVMACGYLENIPSHSENGETEAEPEEEVEETKETEEYVVVESDEVPPADAPEITSSLPPAELPPSTTEEPTLLTSSNGPLMSESILPTHKPQRDVNEVLAAVQGDFNFMQESMIDFQSPHMDPAVVAVATSQPLLPPQQSTQTAIPQSSQDPSTHSTLEQLSHHTPLDQLTQQTTSALESVMRSSNLPSQTLTQEQYSSSTTDQSSSQQHSNLGASPSLSTPSMLAQQTLVPAQTVPLSSTDSQTMSAAHMSQTLPPQSMTAPSQLSESNQLQDSLSSQLSSVQNPSSMSSTVSDPTQSMTLSHEQSQPPQEQSQPVPAKPSQINVNAPPFQSMNYMRQQQQQSYMQQTPQAQIVTSQQLEFTDQSMQQSETQYYSQPPTLQDTQSAHEAQMSVQSAEPHAPGSYPHQHPGMGQPGGYQRPTSAGRGNGRGGRGSRGAGGSTYRGSSRPPFNTRNGRFPSPSYRGGYSYHQPRDYQSNYVPQDRGQYGAGAFSQSGYKRGGGSGAPQRGGVPRGRGTAPRGGNNRGRGGFAKPNQTPVTA